MEQDQNITPNAPTGNDRGEEIPVKVISDVDRIAEHDNRPESEEVERIENALDQLVRLKAEFENYKKRTDRERGSFAEEGQRKIIASLLPVLDDFDHFFKLHEEDDQKIVAGVHLIKNKLYSALETSGLKKFAERGDCFNPELHEAVLVEETGAEFDGKITEVWQPGYAYSGKTLRVAKVKVGKAATENGTE